MKWAVKLAFVAVAVCAVTATEDDEAPSLVILARNTIYNVGEQKAIFCQGKNLPDKNGIWYGPTGAVVSSERGDRVHTYKNTKKMPGVVVFPLINQNVQLNDTGNWTCRAGDLVDYIDVFVGERVIFHKRVEVVDADEGKTVKLDCVAKGYPKPYMQWYKNNRPLGLGNVTVEPKKFWINKKPDNYYLEVKNLNHRDTGEYCCKATQETLSHYMDKVTLLNVLHKPVPLNPETDEELKMHVQEVYAILDEEKNITCYQIAYPLPKYVWSRRENNFDEEILPDSGTIVTTHEGRVSILMLQVTEASLGQYKCSAINNKGTNSIIFHVSLGNKPNAPDDVTFINATVDSLLFNVSCSTCKMEDTPGTSADPKDLKILGYSFMFTPVQEGYTVPDWEAGRDISVDIVNPFETLFTVGPLQNSTKFHARVRTRNAAGFSDWVDVEGELATTDAAVSMAASLLFISISACFAFIMR